MLGVPQKPERPPDRMGQGEQHLTTSRATGEQRQKGKAMKRAKKASTVWVTTDLLAMGNPPWEYVIRRLMGEAQERWGVCSEIPREEVVAWLSSRMTHWTKAWPVPIANAQISGGTPSAQVAGSARGCHNCEHGHLGGWKTYRHWPCLTCRVGSGLCCGDDNWKPNDSGLLRQAQKGASK